MSRERLPASIRRSQMLWAEQPKVAPWSFIVMFASLFSKKTGVLYHSLGSKIKCGFQNPDIFSKRAVMLLRELGAPCVLTDRATDEELQQYQPLKSIQRPTRTIVNLPTLSANSQRTAFSPPPSETSNLTRVVLELHLDGRESARDCPQSIHHTVTQAAPEENATQRSTSAHHLSCEPFMPLYSANDR